MLFGPDILFPKESAITPTMKQDLAFAYQLFPDKGLFDFFFLFCLLTRL